jgi:hypothetical protein
VHLGFINCFALLYIGKDAGVVPSEMSSWGLESLNGNGLPWLQHARAYGPNWHTFVYALLESAGGGVCNGMLLTLCV